MTFDNVLFDCFIFHNSMSVKTYILEEKKKEKKNEFLIQKFMCGNQSVLCYSVSQVLSI